jgi:hypothetical protein
MGVRLVVVMVVAVTVTMTVIVTVIMMTMTMTMTMTPAVSPLSAGLIMAVVAVDDMRRHESMQHARNDLDSEESCHKR